jgi:hypothetical protein
MKSPAANQNKPCGKQLLTHHASLETLRCLALPRQFSTPTTRDGDGSRVASASLRGLGFILAFFRF